MPVISRKLIVTWVTAVLTYAVGVAVARGFFHLTPLEQSVEPGIIAAIASAVAGYIVKESGKFLSADQDRRKAKALSA